MAKKRLKGIDLDPAQIGTRKDGKASQDVWWRQASLQGIEFAYLRFFDGMNAPTSHELNMLTNIGSFDRNKMPLGAYSILDPVADGEVQARLFIDYMSTIRGFWYWKYTLASMYKIRPALWITKSADPSMTRYNALAWLDTVNRFMCEPSAGNEPLYHDKPILATTYALAEQNQLSSDIELRKYHLWIIDESQGAFPKPEQVPDVPQGFKADLWHTKSDLILNGQLVGFDWSIDLGKKEKEPGKRYPIRKLSLIPLALLGGAIYLAQKSKKPAETSSAMSPATYRGMLGLGDDD